MRYLVTLLTALMAQAAPSPVCAAVPAFSDLFGDTERRTMAQLIREVDETASRRFAKLDGAKQAVFLSRFWDQHAPLFSERYVDFHLGRRQPNVADSFYNDPDFLSRDYWVHSPPVDRFDLSRTIAILENLLATNPADDVGRLALGYCYLDADSLGRAEALFIRARKGLRKEAAVYNGLGLAWVKRPKGQTVARDWFRDALALDRGYEAASYNLAMSQIATYAADVPFHVSKVVKAFPHQRDVLYKLGVWYEIRSRFDGDYLEDAIRAYRQQIDVNPQHDAARVNLARVLLDTGAFEMSIRLCRQVLASNPVYRLRALPVLLEAFQATNQMVEADRAARDYVQLLDADTRSHFEDVRLIASREEIGVLDGLEGEERLAFVEDYWRRHDPTPGTPENEKLVEHVRRVAFAMTLYGEARSPWDTRGEVYVRYGEPRHKSRSDNLRFETDPDVIRVRDRLLATLTDEERNQVRQFQRRIRISSRDVRMSATTGLVDVGDFEPAEFGMDPAVGGRRLGKPSPNERDYQRGLIESINDRVPPVEIRGVPLFPVEGNRPWEYWVYPDVGPGIEVVFAALNQHAPYEFAEPPQSGRKLARFTQRTFEHRQPKHVVAQAITTQPSLLRIKARAMPFVYDTSDFRADSGGTRVEFHVGRVADAGVDTVHTEAALMVYDRSWNLVGASRVASTDVPESPADSAFAFVLSERVAPGAYILTAQIDDPKTGAVGTLRIGIEAEDLSPGTLRLSDLAFAKAITVDDDVRWGYRISPHPWRRYRQGEPVVVYYEVYGLRPDSFGQTRYRVDYRIIPTDGGTVVGRALRGIGRQVGIGASGETVISYEQVSGSVDEFSFVEIDVSGTGAGNYAVEVRLTDLVAAESVTKRKTFYVTTTE